MIQDIARIALALMLLCSIVAALWKHNHLVPAHRFNGLIYVALAVFEGSLILLAGGWG